jgi:hypothetical protein
VLHEKLEGAWQARQGAMSISPILKFTTEGLVLGAGTVVVAAGGTRQLKSLQGHEARVLALLSAAYGRAVPMSVISNIKRAAKLPRLHPFGARAVADPGESLRRRAPSLHCR